MKKVLVSLIALIAIGSFGFSFFNGGINAEGTISNTPSGGVASSLHTGDELDGDRADLIFTFYTKCEREIEKGRILSGVRLFLQFIIIRSYKS